MQSQLAVPQSKPLIEYRQVVYTGNCAHCGQPLIHDTVVGALGSNHMCLIHNKCCPFFDFEKGWPHSMPLQFYTKS